MNGDVLNLLCLTMLAVVFVFVFQALRRDARIRLREKIMRSERRLGLPPAQRSDLDYLLPRSRRGHR